LTLREEMYYPRRRGTIPVTMKQVGRVRRREVVRSLGKFTALLLLAALSLGILSGVALAQEEPYAGVEVGGEVITPNPPSAAPPPAVVAAAALAATGFDSGALMVAAATLVLAGFALLMHVRTSRATRAQRIQG
jgi:hypothetical protein